MLPKDTIMGVNIHLKFPSGISTEPIVCHLTRIFDLDFNITKAQISSRRDGYMILELLGSKEKIKEASAYLEQKGIIVSPAAQRIKRDETKCVECGLCTAVCPTASLYMDEARNLAFNTDKCIVCGRCIKVCPVQAMEADIASIGSID